MGERCVPYVVGKGDGICEVLIQPKLSGKVPGNLCNFQGVIESCAKMITGLFWKHLGF
jgi:hypothetical protein